MHRDSLRGIDHKPNEKIIIKGKDKEYIKF